MLYHLAYISSAPSWPSEQDLIDLLKQSRERNERQGITGMLLYANATYMQVLEGTMDDVKDIYASIEKDPRNISNVIILEEEISERDFPGWSMGFRNLTACAPGELDGFSDIFNPDSDSTAPDVDASVAVKLIMSFATSPRNKQNKR